MTTEKEELDPFQKERTELARERTVFARERNQLAAERTFSAWLRTGLAGVGGGLALMRFIHFNNPTKLLVARITGGILLLWGLLVIVFALRSYYQNVKKLELGKTDMISTMGVTAIAIILILLAILVFFLAEY